MLVTQFTTVKLLLSELLKNLTLKFATDAYFRKTGLERSAGLSKDLEWFSQQDLVIPEPSNP